MNVVFKARVATRNIDCFCKTEYNSSSNILTRSSPELNAWFPSYNTYLVENDASNKFSVVVCVYVAAVTFLPAPSIATI
jgi:hypothetical protein